MERETKVANGNEAAVEEKDKKALGERLRVLAEALTQTGLPGREVLAKALDIQRDSLRNYFAGRQSPSAVRVLYLKREVPNLNLDWLFTGEGPMFLEDAEEIPFFREAPAAAGGGAENAGVPAEVVRIPRNLLQRLFGGASGLILVPVWGDSMEPTIPDGALAVVRRFENEGGEVRDGHVYVFLYEGGTYVKRLRRRIVDGEVFLLASSDNALHPSFEIPVSKIERGEAQLQFHIVGRVVGFVAGERHLKARVSDQSPGAR